MKIPIYRGEDREKLLVKIAYRYGALGVSKFAKAIERITDKEEKRKIYHLACEAENYINKDIKDDIEQEEMILVKCAFKLGTLGRKPDALIEQEPDPRVRGFFRNYINKVLLYLDAGHDREEIEFVPSHVICPACGSNKVRVRSQYIGTEVSFTGVCRGCKHEFGSEEPPIKSDYYSEEELEKFKKEIGKFDFHEDKQHWALFLFKKNDGGKISFDLSPKNLARCEENYRRYPKDRNTLFAQLMACVLTDRPWKDLAMDFFQPLPGSSSERAWYVYCFFLGTHRLRKNDAGDWCRSKYLILTSVQKQRLKKFFLWFMDTYPSLFREITQEDLADYEVFGPMSDIIGSKNIARLIDPVEVAWHCLTSPFPCTDMVVMPVVFAEVAYQDERWGLALFFYQKILFCLDETWDFSDSQAVCDAVFHCFHKDIFPRPLKYRDLKSRISECKQGIIKDYTGRSFNEYNEIEIKYFACIFRERERQDKENMENERELTEYHEVCKVAGELVGDHPFLIIKTLERGVREILRETLTRRHGSQRRAWSLGVDKQIQKDVSNYKIDNDPFGRMSNWDCLEFSKYQTIVKDNWEDFEKFFNLGKVQPPKNDRAAFLKGLIPIRNSVMHSRDLSQAETEYLKSSKEQFDKIYERFKSGRRDSK